MILILRERFKSKKGESTIIYVTFMVIFFLMTAIIGLDLSNFYMGNMKVKAAINRAVKASVLQLDTNKNDADSLNFAGKGIFLIDEDKAKKSFYKILSVNLGLDKDTLEPLQRSVLKRKPEILELIVLNDYEKMPYEYYSPTLKSNFLVKNPSVFAVVKFEVNSYFVRKEYTFGKLSSAQLVNIGE